jgi:hypothetical protein
MHEHVGPVPAMTVATLMVREGVDILYKPVWRAVSTSSHSDAEDS